MTNQPTKLITNAQPMVQVAEQDLTALQAKLARLQSVLTEIEALAKEGYYWDDGINAQACLGRILAAIEDAKRD